MRLAVGARRCLVLLLALAAAGCAVSPPDTDYFDVNHRPFGAVPANGGFYVGAYVVAPPFQVIYLLSLFIPHPFGGFPGNSSRDALDWEHMEGISTGVGAMTGAIVGAPFHLVALPFRLLETRPSGRAPVEPVPAVLDEPAPGGDPRYDEKPPAVPRDYPWPPKVGR